MDPINDPGKLKAEATYNAAADHFDDGPLAFWDRYGRRTVERLSLVRGSSVLDVGCGSGASAIPAAINVGPHLLDRIVTHDVSPWLTRQIDRGSHRVRAKCRFKVQARGVSS